MKEVLLLVSAILDELNDLADKFNIPRLRGIKTGKSASYSMAMGDGVLYVDSFTVYTTIIVCYKKKL